MEPPMKLLTILKFPLLAITMLVALLFAISAYSGYVSPQYSGRIILTLGYVFPVLLLLMIGLMVFWWLLSKRISTVLILFFLCCIPRIWYYTPMNIVNKDKDITSQLSVLSYNIHGGGKEKQEKIINYILNSKADIVALQEYTEPVGGELSQMTKRLRKIYPYHRFSAKTQNKWNAQGLALFSKYPIKSAERIGYDSKRNSSELYRIDLYRNELLLINNHFESTGITSADRSYLKELVQGEKELREDVSYRLVNTLAASSGKRAMQADTVAAIIDTVTLPIIVCGDFNDTPISYTYRKLAHHLDDAYIDKGVGPGFTFDTNPIMVRIDHILYGNGLKAINCNITKVNYSDHYPIQAEFTWIEPNS